MVSISSCRLGARGIRSLLEQCLDLLIRIFGLVAEMLVYVVKVLLQLGQGSPDLLNKAVVSEYLSRR